MSIDEGGGGRSAKMSMPHDIKTFTKCLASVKGMDVAAMPAFKPHVVKLDKFVEEANSPAKDRPFLSMLSEVSADAAKKMTSLMSTERHMTKVAANMSKNYFHGKTVRELEQFNEASEELIMLHAAATYLSYNFRCLSTHGRL